MLMLITLLNDGALISIGYDNVHPSPVHSPASALYAHTSLTSIYILLADSGAMEHFVPIHCLQCAWCGSLRLVAPLALGTIRKNQPPALADSRARYFL